ncbi:MAG: hypothetical protein KA715_01380 [Xanthomonadaceae bacterium]|nr:hypothetical protein [Xanthomonadaceae bacterium]
MKKLVTLSLILSGCAEIPLAKWRVEENLELQDRALGRQWFEKIKEKIKFNNDSETDSYLNDLGNVLIRKSEKLKESPLSVFAVKDSDHWSTFGLPGAKIFISMRLLKEIEYESVVAAALAFEISKLEQRSLSKKINLSESDKLTYESILVTPSIHELSESAKSAVRILYYSGYDPRGLVSYWKLLQNNIRVSPIELRSLKVLAEVSFEESTSLPPLMKPVVKSEQFLTIRRRWAK